MLKTSSMCRVQEKVKHMKIAGEKISPHLIIPDSCTTSLYLTFIGMFTGKESGNGSLILFHTNTSAE